MHLMLSADFGPMRSKKEECSSRVNSGLRMVAVVQSSSVMCSKFSLLASNRFCPLLAVK